MNPIRKARTKGRSIRRQLNLCFGLHFSWARHDDINWQAKFKLWMLTNHRLHKPICTAESFAKNRRNACSVSAPLTKLKSALPFCSGVTSAIAWKGRWPRRGFEIFVSVACANSAWVSSNTGPAARKHKTITFVWDFYCFLSVWLTINFWRRGLFLSCEL